MMTNEEFNEIVSNDVKGVLDKERAHWLRSPEVLDRWIDELKATMRKIDSQLCAHKAEHHKKRRECEDLGEAGDRIYLNFQIEESTWKASAVWFKRSVEDRLTEAKQIRRRLHDEENIEIIKLRSAITNHRDSFEELEPSDDDEELWKVLEA